MHADNDRAAAEHESNEPVQQEDDHA
jgi:hypothetical protein